MEPERMEDFHLLAPSQESLSEQGVVRALCRLLPLSPQEYLERNLGYLKLHSQLPWAQQNLFGNLQPHGGPRRALPEKGCSRGVRPVARVPRGVRGLEVAVERLQHIGVPWKCQ